MAAIGSDVAASVAVHLAHFIILVLVFPCPLPLVCALPFHGRYLEKRSPCEAPLSLKSVLYFLLSASLILLILFFVPYCTSSPNPVPNSIKTLTLHHSIRPFDCYSSPQAHPVIANLVEGLKPPFLFSLSDFGSLPGKPHKNIVRILKGKTFRRPDISKTVQDLIEKMRGKGKDGIFVDVGANVGMASFAAAVMGVRVLAFEPVFENLQRICDGVYFNRVRELVTVFEAAVSDRNGNISFHKLVGRLDNCAVSATGAKMAFKSNEQIELQVKSIPPDEVIPKSEPVLLLKIDVQGWEYHVLKGTSKLLSRKRGRAPYVMYEEDKRLLQASNSSAEEVQDFLHRVGYHDCTRHGTGAHCTK